VIEVTRPKLNRFKYSAMLLAAVAVAAFPPAGLTAVASAEKVWDIEDYDNCMADQTGNQLDLSINDQKAFHAYCCNRSGGIFIDDGYLGKCVAPPGNRLQARGSFRATFTSHPTSPPHQR
jgi:hypothetical protein